MAQSAHSHRFSTVSRRFLTVFPASPARASFDESTVEPLFRSLPTLKNRETGPPGRRLLVLQSSLATLGMTSSGGQPARRTNRFESLDPVDAGKYSYGG